jgi:hypothetical protein
MEEFTCETAFFIAGTEYDIALLLPSIGQNRAVRN